MKRASFLPPVLVLALICWRATPLIAQVSITSTGVQYSENFDIGSSGTASLNTGWKVDTNASARTVGTYSGASSATQYAAAASMSSTATYGIYNYGNSTVGSTDRAVGFLSTSNTAMKSGNLYVQLLNNTASTISTWTISYDVEKYRDGTNSKGFQIQLYYSTDGSAWTSAGNNFLIQFPTADATNNGYTTTPGTTSSITATALNLNISSGSSLYLAWNYSVISGTTTSSAQALGVDNFKVTAASAVPEPSTYAAIAGVFALGGVMWHRRRQRSAAAKA